MSEQWLNVPNYGGRYQVSDCGRIASCPATRPPKTLKQWRDTKGYLQIGLRLDGERHIWRVHRLVMLAFVGPCAEGVQVNHKDGVKTNNRLDNLEYVTQAENMQHALRTGLREITYVPGEKHPKHKLTEEQARGILASTEVGAVLARKLGVSKTLVNRIRARQVWKHLATG